MSDPGQHVLDQALALPLEERARLALRLTESLDGPNDEGAEAAWAKVLARRVAEVEAGTAELVSAEDAVARARARIRRP